MKFENAKILGIGSPIVDLLLQVSDAELEAISVDKGAMTLVDADAQENILSALNRKPVMTPGGSAGNTLFALARLGVETAMRGTVGLDMYGQLYCQEFSKLGGQLEHFSFTDKLSTARCLSLITPDTERTMFTNLSAANLMNQPMDFTGFDFIYFEGYVLYNPAADQLFEAAKASGAKIGFDLGDFKIVEIFKERIVNLLRDTVDILFANEKEALAFCDDSNPEVQAKIFGEFCEIAVVKLGAEGCVVKGRDGKISKCSAIKVEAIDTTAAGDLFQAGFIFGLLNNRTMEECAFYGAILGAEVVKVIGTVIPPDRWTASLVRMGL